MIVKKVKAAPFRAKTKAAHVRDLTEYIRSPRGEKVLYSSSRHFLTEEPNAQCAEMVALALEAVRSKNPVSHYILSWREGEQPSPQQAEDAVSVLLHELELDEHQAIYALHRDTDNIHLHIAVNRVHPESLRVVKPNKGFDIEAAHRAVARIEHEQGWSREQGGRYVVLEDGDLGRAHSDRAPRHPDQRRQDMEHRTGEKSAERTAIEVAGPIILAATSWRELHEQLAAQGMRYERKGSGALLWVGDVAVKASSAARHASLSALQKRLGAYEPSPAQQVETRAPESIKRDAPGWNRYSEMRRAHYDAKERATIEQRRRHEEERRAAREAQRDERGRALPRLPKYTLGPMKSILAAQHAAQRAELQDRHRRERAELRQAYPRFLDYEAWLRVEMSPKAAEQWRRRLSEPDQVHGETYDPPRPRDIRDFTAYVAPSSTAVMYRRQSAPGGAASFIDHGSRIDIQDSVDRDTVLAALQLSAQKWGRFEVTGSDAFKATCAALAAEHGFQLTNAELQERIAQERQRIARETVEAMKPKELRLFEAYHAALGADRYRVTAIKMQPDGRKQTFILDKATKGFTPEEIARRTPEMQRLQCCGESLYYTPLSATKHHVLVDDLSAEKLDRLLHDGYRPAAVLESSAGRYQALITVPKLGTAHDRDVGNRLAERLNREYGDPNLSGATHPHCAPGYQNRKLEHGDFPEVRLVTAERRECPKTLELARAIDAEYQQQGREKACRVPLELPTPAAGAPPRSVAEAYLRHCQDVMRRQTGAINFSRVDSMVAVRLRMTGHSKAEIEAAILQCAPGLREQPERRNWPDYAARTTRYAFGHDGDRRVAELARYRDQWTQLEGPAKAREQDERGDRGR